MLDDAELLRRYASERSETTFSELARRHIDLVYSAALRETDGDRSLAEDVTQSVFLELARKAPSLLRHPALAGWLYTCVRHTAANSRRAEFRRRRREMEALAMNELSAPEPADPRWAELVPVLDDAMHALGETDRAAVVLRFFEQRTLQEVGTALNLTKSAAHMRIDRALERLRVLLLRRGVKSTTSGLAAVLLVGATASAPAGLAASIATTVIQATATTGGTALLAQTARIMATSKLKLGIAAALLAAGIVAPLALRQPNNEKPPQASLERQLAAQDKAPFSPPAPRNADTIPVAPEKKDPSQPGVEPTPPQRPGTGEPESPAVASREKIPARAAKRPGSAAPSETDSQAGARLQRITTDQAVRITGETATTIQFIPPNGEAAFMVDPLGGLHLMRFQDGDWEETDLPPDDIVPTGGFLAVVGPDPASTAAGASPLADAIVTNAPSASGIH